MSAESSLRGRTRVVVRALSWLVVAPGVLGHELAHAVVGWLLGARVGWVRVEGRPAVRMAWPSGVSGWRVRVAHLAPVLCAPLAAVAAGGAVWVAANVATSSTVFMLALAIVVGNLLVFVLPSYEDLHPGGGG